MRPSWPGQPHTPTPGHAPGGSAPWPRGRVPRNHGAAPVILAPKISSCGHHAQPQSGPRGRVGWWWPGHGPGWRVEKEEGGDRGAQRAHSQTTDSQTRQKRRMLAHRPQTDPDTRSDHRQTGRPDIVTDVFVQSGNRDGSTCVVRPIKLTHRPQTWTGTKSDPRHTESDKIQTKGYNGADNTYTQSDHKQSGQRHTGTCQDQRHTAR